MIKSKFFNKKDKIFKLIILSNILIITISFLSSCDPACRDLYFIENNSSYEIELNYRNYQNDTIIIIPSMQKQLFYEEFNIGITSDYGDNFLLYFDTISLKINDTILINKDYTKRTNWNFEITYNHKIGDGGTGNYSFYINDEDVSIIDKN